MRRAPSTSPIRSRTRTEALPGPEASSSIVPGQAPTVFATDACSLNPTGVAIDAAGNILVADLNGDPDNLGGNTGAIFRFDPVTANVATSKAGAEYRGPMGRGREARGDVLVADREALGRPPDLHPG